MSLFLCQILPTFGIGGGGTSHFISFSFQYTKEGCTTNQTIIAKCRVLKEDFQMICYRLKQYGKLGKLEIVSKLYLSFCLGKILKLEMIKLFLGCCKLAFGLILALQAPIKARPPLANTKALQLPG